MDKRGIGFDHKHMLEAAREQSVRREGQEAAGHKDRHQLGYDRRCSSCKILLCGISASQSIQVKAFFTLKYH